MKKLKVAIIGCGRIAVRHAASAYNSEYADLVACCDIRAERAETFGERYGARAYTDYEKMIEKEELDAVQLCLPHYLHIPVSLYALERGIPVLCEKPMSTDYESAERAVRFAEEKGVPFGIIMQCRYNEAPSFVKAAVTSGKLGKILSARSVLTWKRDDKYYTSSDWKGTWDKEGGGVVIDQAIHSIDLVNWIVDSEIEHLSCSMANRGHETVAVEDSAEGLITYKNGVRYGFYCMNNYGCDEPIEIRLCCENGKAVFTYDTATITYKDGTKDTVTEQNVIPKEGKDYWGNKHARQIDQFYRAVLGLEPLEITAREALRTHKLICAIYDEGKKHFSTHKKMP